MAYPRIVFHHVPKCGGTSLVRGLALTYYPLRLALKGRSGFPGGLDVHATRKTSELFHEDRFQFRRKLLCYQLEKDDSPLVFGHYPFSREVYESSRSRWSFITLLRNPIDRWYSEYFYNRYKTSGVGKTELDIEPFLDSSEGRGCARSFVNFLIDADDPYAYASETEARAALQQLELFDVVGHLEELDLFRDSMKQKFGRRPFFPHLNRSPVRTDDAKLPDPESSFHKRLLEQLSADLLIYETSRNRL